MKSNSNKKCENLNLEQLRISNEKSIITRFQKIPDDTVFNEAFRDSVYSEHSLRHISYSRSKSYFIDGEEDFTLNNVPDGFPFVLYKKYPYAQFRFAVDGNPDLIKNLCNSTLFRINDLFYSSDKLQDFIRFRKYLQFPFIENEELVAQINNEAGEKKQFIKESISQFNSQIDEFNILLKDFSEKEFLKEKQKRELKKSLKDKLNPF